jgi:hypothetical protein
MSCRRIIQGIGRPRWEPRNSSSQALQPSACTRIDRLNSTISIQQTQKGTVGGSAGGAGALQEYKAKDAAMLDAVHAGDRVSYSATDNNGTGTLTKLQKQ